VNILEPDWGQERPDDAAVRAMWHELRITPRHHDGPEIQTLLGSLRNSHVNGGAVFASFTIAEHPTLHWFTSRNRLDELEFPERFLSAPAVSTVLTEVCAGAKPAPFGFQWGSSFTLSGEIARTLAEGGAYEKHKAGAADAYAVAERFRAWLFGDRFEEIHVLVSHQPWSDWFYEIAWDCTWLILDKRYSVVSVLAVTDTD
jgi:hypothetical protein